MSVELAAFVASDARARGLTACLAMASATSQKRVLGQHRMALGRVGLCLLHAGLASARCVIGQGDARSALSVSGTDDHGDGRARRVCSARALCLAT